MAKYSHAYDIGFEVHSDEEDASDITAAMLKTALERRIACLGSLDDLAWADAVDCFDTCELSPDPRNALAHLRQHLVGDTLVRRKELSRTRRELMHEQELYDDGRLEDDD